jgi:NADPH-dependent ferric siderophore reductase
MTSMTTSDAPRERRARPQAVLHVQRREQLNAHLVRIVAGGPGMAQFRPNDFTDKYVKLLFVDAELGLTPPYDLDELRASLPPEQRPVSRTYTVRSVDLDAQQLTLDFVTHGEEGLAAPWAAQAEPGDVLTLSGAGGAYRPNPDVDWHLFAGDESALPAISSALEALGHDASGIAYLETADAGHYLDAAVPTGVDVVWLERPEPGAQPQLLADAISAGPWPAGRVGVFAHGERESMKAARAALRGRLSDQDELSLSGYWAYGRTEDRFQAEKREPVGRIS